MKREYSPIDYESSRNKTIRTLGRKLKELENAYNKALDDILERLGFDKENEV